MEINKKNRTELKSYFLANKIPTQRDFEDFIDAQLNQAEDGIAKVQGSPIALEAEGDPGGPQEVMNLFGSFADANPSWGISLNPRVDPAVPASNKPGLNFKDATGASRLFLKSAGGEIGIGTIEPTSKLSIRAEEDASMISVTSGSSGSAHIFEVAQENGDGALSLRGGNGTLVSRLSGTASKPSFFLSKVGMGTENPSAHLHLSGDDTELRITDNKTGGLPRMMLDSKNGQTWWVQGGETFQVTPDRSDDGVLRLEKDGHLKLSGGFTVGASSTDINGDGSLYRKGSGTFLTIDDHFYIRHPSRGNQLHLNTTNGRMAVGGANPLAPLSITGTGKDGSPDAAMHITSGSILFGGNNAGGSSNSAKIMVDEDKTLKIYGQTTGTNAATRKVEIAAEGGLTVNGRIKTPIHHVVAFSVAISENNLSGTRNPQTFGHVNHDAGNDFKNGTHFIAPIAGIYMFTMTISKASSPSGYCYWGLRLNGTGYVNGEGGGEISERAVLRTTDSLNSYSRTVTTMLNAGDTVHIEQTGSSRPDNFSSSFEGILLQALT